MQASIHRYGRLRYNIRLHCDSNDVTGEPMRYFEASDGKLERIGKVIGDTISALVILFVIGLAFSAMFR